MRNEINELCAGCSPESQSMCAISGFCSRNPEDSGVDTLIQKAQHGPIKASRIPAFRVHRVEKLPVGKTPKEAKTKLFTKKFLDGEAHGL